MNETRLQITLLIAIPVMVLSGLMAWYILPYMPVVIKVVLWSVAALAAIVTIGTLYYYGHVVYLDIKGKKQDLQIAAERHELEKHLALTRIAADQLGNYPVHHDPQNGFTYLSPGNPAYSPLRTRVVESQPEQQQLAAPSQQVIQPSLDMLAAQLRFNSLEIAYGVTMNAGKVIKASIAESVHFKLIGSSGFGKSCLAACLLHLATMTNDSDHLRIALLDLEHKTSRLFEHLPHVAEIKIGRKSTDMVAPDADEVARKLRVLVQELKRRADRQIETPLLLIYVEEMLSLQYEVDETLLAQMLADLSILALRGRKYGMFLLACSQTDYATDELRAAQKQFRSRIAFACDPSSARAAGFINTNLIKQNYQTGEPGQFVLEKPAFSELMLAPAYDVKQALERSMKPALSRRETGSFNRETSTSFHVVKSSEIEDETSDETASQAKIQAVQGLLDAGFNQGQILLKLWNVRPGATESYQTAKVEYQQIIAQIEEQEVEEA